MIHTDSSSCVGSQSRLAVGAGHQGWDLASSGGRGRGGGSPSRAFGDGLPLPRPRAPVESLLYPSSYFAVSRCPLGGRGQLHALGSAYEASEEFHLKNFVASATHKKRLKTFDVIHLLILQMGKPRPREGKGRAHMHTARQALGAVFASNERL